VKAAGGITIAQLPESAKYDGMPRAAIATGMVDLRLRPGEIAAELVRIARHPYVHDAPPAAAELPIGESSPPTPRGRTSSRAGLHAAAQRERRRLQQYKMPTILRRMTAARAAQAPGIPQYLEYVRENPSEIERLYQDILIHVTRFFASPSRSTR